MGFLRRLRGGSKAAGTWPPAGPITSWPGETWSGSLTAYLFPPVGRSVVEVVGEGSYQGTLERVGGGKTGDGMRDHDQVALLLPEPANPYDANAVRVIIQPSKPGQTMGKVGYLSREDAVGYRPVIDRLAALGTVVACRASLKGGWDRGPADRGSIGVTLYLGTVADCEAQMARDPPTPSC
jgi:hypothetical protein